MTRAALVLAICTIACGVVLYTYLIFVAGEMNPIRWGSQARLGIATFWLTYSILFAVMALTKRQGR